MPATAHLGVLGVTGFTAWLGLTEIAGLREGEVVFVSGAAGSVGSAVGQIAKLKGASRTIGSAGGPEKARLLTERYGFDVGLDYKAAPIRRQLVAATGTEQGEGIDVYFDNVGGDHLEAALEVFNDGGRAALCGAIAGYNDERRVAGTGQPVARDHPRASPCGGSRSRPGSGCSPRSWRRSRRGWRTAASCSTRRSARASTRQWTRSST